MRKIISRQERENKAKKNQAVIGIILAVIILSSIVSYAFGGKDEESAKISYNGIEFAQKDNSWNFNIQGFNFITQYNPKEVPQINSLSKSINDYVNNPLYFHSPYNQASLEISRNLNQFASRINLACISDISDISDKCQGDYPIKNCSTDNIIIIQDSAENESERIYQEENCIFIVADAENQTKFADAFLFEILGI